MARDRATRARHLAREQLVKALYQWQIAGHSVAEIRSQFSTAEDFERSDRDYFAELLSAIVDDATALDELISAGRTERGIHHGGLPKLDPGRARQVSALAEA
mgnify:CR=1 FL=1